MNIRLINEGQECKIGPVRGRVPVAGGRRMERVKKDEYMVDVFYILVRK
jgi:hypothetical protein